MAHIDKQATTILADLDNYPYERTAFVTFISLAKAVADADNQNAHTFDSPTVRKERVALAAEALLNYATESNHDLEAAIRRLEMSLLEIAAQPATAADPSEEPKTD